MTYTHNFHFGPGDIHGDVCHPGNVQRKCHSNCQANVLFYHQSGERQQMMFNISGLAISTLKVL